MNKRLFLTVTGLLLVGFIFAQSANKNKRQEIILTNTSSVALTGKAISIKRNNFKIPKGTVYPLLQSSANDTIPAQLDDLDGDNKWDELFFVVTIPANSTNTYSINWVTTQPVFEKRTSVRLENAPLQPLLYNRPPVKQFIKMSYRKA